MSRKKITVLLLLLGIVGIWGAGCVVGPVFPIGPGPYAPYPHPHPHPLPGPRVVIIP